MFESKEEGQGLLLDEENSHQEEASVDIIQAQIDQIKEKEAELAKKRQEIQEVTQNKEAFLAYKEEVENNFLETLPQMEDLILSLDKDLEKLKAAEEEFNHWRSKMKDLRVEEWSNDRIKSSLGDAKSFVSQANQAYTDTQKEFSHSSNVCLFRKRKKVNSAEPQAGLAYIVKQGFWFHFPLFVFAVIIMYILGFI